MKTKGLIPVAFDIDEYAAEGITQLEELLRRWAEFTVYAVEHEEAA